tara:strand:- start:41 stop:568 length:528 start_codon:yes stop_codon:yes gene_type:complete
MSQYFKYFPKLYYDAVGNGNPKLVTNILKRVKVKDGVKNDVALFDKYQVKFGESPELTSFKLYGSVDYYWTILLMNNIRDRFYEWPLTEHQFEEYVSAKYTNPGAVHHYEIAQTSGPTTSLDRSHLIEVNEDTTGATAVSNYEYERRIQDNLSLIKVLKPNFLSPFVEEFAKLVR